MGMGMAGEVEEGIRIIMPIQDIWDGRRGIQGRGMERGARTTIRVVLGGRLQRNLGAGELLR